MKRKDIIGEYRKRWNEFSEEKRLKYIKKTILNFQCYCVSINNSNQ